MGNNDTPEQNQNGETDIKKTIQKLSGQLSQKLNDYNAEGNGDESEVNKYVIGMVIKQAMKGLDDEDRSDVINNIVSGDGDNESDVSDNAGETSEQPLEDKEPTNGFNENKRYKFRKKQLTEIFSKIK